MTVGPPPQSSHPWWERDDLRHENGCLLLAGQDVGRLAAEAGRPLFLYALSRVEANARRVHAALAESGCRPQLLYAMKANRFPPLLERLAQTGMCGIDICSPAELDLALACGFRPDQISFTGTGVSNRDLDRLLVHHDLAINCDTMGMIRRIGERTPGRSIGIRINPGIGTGYDDHDRLTYAGRRTTKFGIYREQWPEALGLARRFDLKITGVHFHVGCGYLGEQLGGWEQAVMAAVGFLAGLPDLRIVNVGGGLGLPHRHSDRALDLSLWSAILRRHFAGRGLTLAAEPGDYIAKDAGILVLGVTDVEWKRETRFVSVDGGFNLHPEPAFYDLPCQPVACRPRAGAWERVTIAGNINEALDIWAPDISMPPLEEGDFIAFLNAGGYGAAMSSNHCMRGDFIERAV